MVSIGAVEFREPLTGVSAMDAALSGFMARQLFETGCCRSFVKNLISGYHRIRPEPELTNNYTMPFHSIWEPLCVLTIWTGRATGDELLAYIRAAQSNPQFDDVHYSLHDFTACTGTEFSLASIEELAAMDSVGAHSNPNNIKIAVVADRSDVIAAVGDYIGTEMSPYPVRIFSTIDAAREWACK